MNLADALDLARRQRLYPGIIVHGGDDAQRRDAAVQLARVVLCGREPDERPCGECRHCSRIGGTEETAFHPDFVMLERDLKTATSVAAVKAMLRTAQVRPFEARGQVFVVASAESLGGAGANALLKNLEEPAESVPRHFLLLAPAAGDLLPTLRSRCLPMYLGAPASLDEDALGERVAALRASIAQLEPGRTELALLGLARDLESFCDWRDPRSHRPWIETSEVVLAMAREIDDPWLRRALLGFAAELLEAPEWRLRAISPTRILEGLAARWLAVPGRLPAVAAPSVVPG